MSNSANANPTVSQLNLRTSEERSREIQLRQAQNSRRRFFVGKAKEQRSILKQLGRLEKEITRIRKKIPQKAQSSDFFYVISIILALFKDFLDVLTTIPVIGLIITLMFALAIGLGISLLLTFAHYSEKPRQNSALIMRISLVISTGMFETLIPLINIIPIYTITLIAIYISVKKVRRKARLKYNSKLNNLLRQHKKLARQLR